MATSVPAAGVDEEEQEHRYSIQDFTLGHEIAFNVVICMGQLMTQAGLAMTIVPLHIIGDHFQVTNPGQLSWLAAVSWFKDVAATDTTCDFILNSCT